MKQHVRETIAEAFRQEIATQVRALSGDYERKIDSQLKFQFEIVQGRIDREIIRRMGHTVNDYIDRRVKERLTELLKALSSNLS